MKIAVLYGSVRTARQGIKGAKFICTQLRKRKHEVTLVDAKEHELPLLDKMYKEYKAGEAPEVLEKLASILNAAEAMIIVSGEYNHGLPPGLKNMLDHFQREFYFKTCGLATYSAGPFGGVRAGIHLRSVMGELGMVTCPTIFAMSKVGVSFDEEGNALDEAYNKRVERFLSGFEWFAEALNEQRKNGLPY